MAEKLRQFVTVQLQSIDVPASLAIEAVFAAQNRPAVLERPDTCPSGVGDISEGLGQNVVPEFVDAQSCKFSFDLTQHGAAPRRGNELAGIVDDDCTTGSSDLQRTKKMRECIEGDVDAKQVEAPVWVAIFGGCCDPRNALAEKDIDAGPEQMVVCERALVPRACARIVGVRRILLPSDLVAGGVAMDPGDAARSGHVLDELDVDAIVAAAANQDEIAII